MASKKYKLLAAESIVPSLSGWATGKIPMYRIQALQDIPGTGIKRGDIGGYVTDENILSHEGTCWISGNAQVMGAVKILDDAQVMGNAVISCRWNYSSVTIKERAVVRGNAEISIVKKVETQEPRVHTVIGGSSTISDHARIKNMGQISGYVQVINHALLEGVSLLRGTIIIRDYAHLQRKVQVLGTSSVSDKCVIHEGAKIIDCTVSDDAQIAADQTFTDREFDERALYVNEEIELPRIAVDDEGNVSQKKPVSISSKSNPSARLFEEIKANMASYETDIVKIIKYPAMVDQGVDATLEMTLALKKATRLAEDMSTPEFEAAVELLERKFLVAESNAIKLSSSMLSDEDKKKTKDAKVMLDKATDEASTENEKKMAFTQGFKQLEGIIAVPEIAIDAFRVKVGLKELEI